MTHEIELKQKTMDALLFGGKTFIATQNDKYYQKGDTLDVTITDEGGIPIDEHPDNRTLFEITFVQHVVGIDESVTILCVKRKTALKTTEEEIQEEHERIISWLGKFCKHIDKLGTPLTDEENTEFFRQKMNDQFNW